MDIRSKFTIAAETTGQAFVDGLARSVGKVEQGVARIPAAARAAATAFAGFATAGVVALAAATKGAIDYAGEIGDAAERTGLAREAFQELRFAAQQSGIQADVFESAMSRLTVTIGAAATGTKAQADMFARLGISVRDAGGNVRSTDAVLKDLADAIAAVDSPAEQARIATEALGRAAGPQLAVLLRRGSDGLNDLRVKAKETGAVIGDDLIRQAEDAGDELDALSDVIRATLSSALIRLTPLITKAGQAFADVSGKAAEFFDEIQRVPISRALAAIDTYGDRVQKLRAQLRGEGILGAVLGPPAAGSVAERTIKENLERELAGLERAKRELARLRNQAAPLPRAPRPEQPAGDPSEDPATDPPIRTGNRGAISAALDFDSLENQDVRDIRQRLATEAQEAERLRDVIDDIEGELPALADEAGDSVAELWEHNNDIAERALADLQDITGAAAQGIANTLEDGVFALFEDGVDGMVDVFNRALQRMILDLANSTIQEELQKLFTEALGTGKGTTGGIVSSIIGAFAGSFGGGELSKANASGPSGGAKFAAGGSFVVPGPASGDRVIPIFRANGGEIVDISQPGRRRGGGGVQVVNNIDARGADPASEARIRREIEASERRTVAQVAALAKRGRL